MKNLVNDAKRCLVPSVEMYQTFAQLGFSMNQFEVCPYGIDTSNLDTDYIRKPWLGTDDRPLRIGYIGSITRAKGLHVFLQSLNFLSNIELNSCKIHIYGDVAHDTDYSQSLTDAYSNTSYLNWKGTFPSSEVYQVLQNLDLLVVPSIWRENSPLIVSQAIATGLPIFLSDVEGMRSQVEDYVNARLFPVGDSLSLASLLSSAISNPSILFTPNDRSPSCRTIFDYGQQLHLVYTSVLSS